MIIPNRSYYLLHGPLSDFGRWGVRETGHNPASFVWPADHAWCIASDVDAHWAGIGANAETIADLLTHTDLDIVTADPDSGAPAEYAAPTRYFTRPDDHKWCNTLRVNSFEDTGLFL
ncbi:hypothetical protein ABID74_004931 [Gordonia terrae]